MLAPAPYLKLLFIILGLSLAVLNSSFSVAQNTESTIVIVAHPENPISSISKSKLKAIYSMHLQEWPNGASVKVYVLPDRHKIHRQFTKSKLGFFPYQLRRNWDRQVFSGTGDAPLTLPEMEAMKKNVATNKNAIGYLPLSVVDKSVKILKVE